MAEYIDRDAFVMETQRRVCAFCDKRKGMKNGKYRVIYEIGDAPCRACGVDDMISEVEEFHAADVQPVKHGRWINICGDSESMRQCSECLQDFDYIDGICYLVSGQRLPLYCPNCGAKMDGET